MSPGIPPKFSVGTDTFKENALRSLIGDIQKRIGIGPNMPGASRTGGDKSPLEALGKITRHGTEGDRLAKIGGFIGGGQNIMSDYMRRTASAICTSFW